MRGAPVHKGGRPFWRLYGLTGGVVLLAIGVSLWFWLGRQANVQSAQALLHCPLPAQPASAPHPGMVWVPGGRFEFGDTEQVFGMPVDPRTNDYVNGHFG